MPKEEDQDPNTDEQQADLDASSSDDEKSDSDSDYPSDYSYSDYSDGEQDPDQDSNQVQDQDKNFRNIFRFQRRENQPRPPHKNSPEANYREFAAVLDSPLMQKMYEKEDPEYIPDDEAFNFPYDPQNWTEEDLGELWADGDNNIGGTGWDPVWATKDEFKYVKNQIANGRRPRIAPFYVPYRKPFPVIPDNDYEIDSPKAVIHELDRIEEFLKWVSYIFEDGSSYEGTVWDDYAQGKGVFASRDGLVRYEGEWLQNNPEGHGVIEVDIPVVEPVPGSKLEKKMRAQGRILKMDFVPEEDKEWLKMDIEDSYRLADGRLEIPWYENEEWVRQFGSKPEKGRYRYAGQWKHGRFHGCGVYSVNERITYGRFYFGEYVGEGEGCDDETSALHSGIAEVAAAKARMFVNKPDGMVREERGPYGDPQHAYFYEEEDVWMAPGFINQFYKVPDYWKTYVQEVDQEREMWLNSFYKAPLRLPMPSELEYWWANEKYHAPPEFILINKEPEPDPEDPSKLIYTDLPLILHTPTGHLINYVEDEEHGIRLFWQPPVEKGEDVDPDKAQFLPLGYDEFFGTVKEEIRVVSLWDRLLLAVGNACKPWFDKLNKWAEEQKQKVEQRQKELDEEVELMDVEVRLEDAMEQMDELLRLREKEAQKRAEMGLPDDDEDEEDDLDLFKIDDVDEKEDDDEEEDEDEDEDEDEKTDKTSVPKQDKTARTVAKQDKKAVPVTNQDKKAAPIIKQDDKATSVTKQDKKAPAEEEEEGDYEGDEEEEVEDDAQASFGSVEQEQTMDRQKGKPGKSPFSTSSLAFASVSLITAVPCKLQQSFSFWNKGRSKLEPKALHSDCTSDLKTVDSVRFRQVTAQNVGLKAIGKAHRSVKAISSSGGKFSEAWSSKTRSHFLDSGNSKRNLMEPRDSSIMWLHEAPERDIDSILSLHSSICSFQDHRDTVR
ncbi:hypothetical protein PIB30_067637 [Stylosanthes scabra]|uniref:Uncharacterized protein n=1 Tax=Stylosanthes scabra TaxID=79078 RepID=A0ABU6YMZ5_9FABA|nr:hypothetical protein [Stylosanthes scabra]